jgi:phage baseplate assembly protein V
MALQLGGYAALVDVDSRNAFPRTKIGRDHQVRDQFRNGMVIDRKFDKDRGPLVRVQYMDRQGLISYWLPVKQFGSRKTAHVYTPKIGDHVNVNMLCNGSEDGFVDGSFFNKKNPPPEVDIDTRHFLTEDGTIVEYREKDSTFNLNCVGVVIVQAAGEITITSTIKVTVTAPEIALNGHMVLNGLITHTGDMTTTGVHTDANGVHHGSAKEERDLEAEVDQLKAEVLSLKERFFALEAKVRKGAGE